MSADVMNRTVPEEITAAVQAAVGKTFEAMYGERPQERPTEEIDTDVPHVAGIISFVGDEKWSLCWMLPQPTAERMAAQFMGGMEVPFDSEDMADIAGELVNILAGEVVAQLDRHGMPAQMSLPTVARGVGLRVFPDHGNGVARTTHDSPLSSFSFRVAYGPDGAGHRMPGH